MDEKLLNAIKCARITTLVGKSNTGKSFLTMSLMKKFPERIKKIYISNEMHRRMVERYANLIDVKAEIIISTSRSLSDIIEKVNYDN